MPAALDVNRHSEERPWFEVRRHPEEPSEARRLEGGRQTPHHEGRVSKDDRPRPGRRPPISGLPEIGIIARKSATADLRWLAARAPQGDGNESALITSCTDAATAYAPESRVPSSAPASRGT